MYDVVIIGGGVTGAAVARELSKYRLNICVIEKGEDVCSGTSKANSAIIHAGFDAKEGSLMAKMNVRGNAMMDELARDLDIPFRRNGAMVVCVDPAEKDGLRTLYDRGIANHVPGLRILDREKALAMEPNLSDNTVAALYAPTSGIICPFILTIAMAEQAYVNGVDFHFNTEAEDIRKENGIFLIRTGNGVYRTRCVVNAAGVYADRFHNMVSKRKIHITPRSLVTPTVHGNLLIGPTAEDIDDREGTNTTAEGLQEVIRKAGQHVKNIPMREVITSFAGLRAHEDGHEFILGEPEDAPGFVDCAGIESPGLSSSPAIGEYIGNLVRDMLHADEKENWIAQRKGILHPADLSFEERNELIRREPAYGRIICRCESVTEGEILDAIRRPLGARSLDGIKRRTRAGMGRCQAGFCSPRVMEILHRELGIPYEQLTKCGGESKLVMGRTKEDER